MAFITDKQTLNDLNILGRGGNDSIYGLFNATRTRGGARLLEEMFLYPLSDPGKINRRSGIIRYFAGAGLEFPFRGELLDTLEHYIADTDSRTRMAAEDNNLQRRIRGAVGGDAQYERLHKGVVACIEAVATAEAFIARLAEACDCTPYRERAEDIAGLLGDAGLQPLLKEKGTRKLAYARTAQLDTLIRFGVREKVVRLLQWACELDVYISVARVAADRKFAFATALPAGSDAMEIKEMYHPCVKNAVGNSLRIDRSNNMIFLTGANMAGKSTFMKTLGVTVFLAHMGFPVPAGAMEFPVLDGMYTTINLPDNIAHGYSHFYAEVLRVKKVAEQLGKARNLLVMFDELFRGTNVKDAYDATVAVVEAFAAKRDCLFVISTHVIEAGERLLKLCDNINCVYLPTVMEEGRVRYTYTLARGITDDRHGMMIVNNERILDILDRNAPSAAPHMPAESFITDQQTLDDLNIPGEFKAGSIFSIFNRTRTRGGKRLMETMFANPLTDAGQINDRSSVFAFFQRLDLEFPLPEQTLARLEGYLAAPGPESLAASLALTARHKAMALTAADKAYGQLVEGIGAACSFLRAVRQIADRIDRNAPPQAYLPSLNRINGLLADKRLAWVFGPEGERTPSWYVAAHRDHVLRGVMARELRALMDEFHFWDVCIAVSQTARAKELHYAVALPFVQGANYISVEGVRHPALANAVANPIRLDCNRNVLFLTGANMAGKSTLMKSFATAVYLAHAGFPVAASAMEFSVQEGLYTSINVSDDISLGYSHYYAEVMRVKKVALDVASGKRLVVVFDELFKGTNVKDAYDATVAVAGSFAAYTDCTYVISTHIIEAGHALSGQCGNLRFAYMPTVMEEARPRYPYTLTEGITDDRHGMVIINNERIVETIKSQA